MFLIVRAIQKKRKARQAQQVSAQAPKPSSPSPSIPLVQQATAPPGLLSVPNNTNGDGSVDHSPVNSLATFDSKSKTYTSQRGLVTREMLVRTPSPTPSEDEALASTRRSTAERIWHLVDPRIRFAPKNIVGTIAVILILGAVIAMFAENKEIVRALQPAGRWLKSKPYGFVIPAAILFVLSFPPLLGHEIVGMLVGVFYGLGVGFAIAVVGQLLGECCSFFLFKYACVNRVENLKKRNITYAALARVVQEGGFFIVLISRYSIIPQHVTTAIYASVGVRFWQFLLAALLSTPRILLSVVIGYTLAPELNGSSPSNTSKKISAAVVVATAVVTSVAMRVVRARVNKVVPEIVYARRKTRQVVAFEGGSDYNEAAEPSTSAGDASPYSARV